MDIFFSDPSEVPLPPNEVRIRQLSGSPWPDGRRVRVALEVDPFQQRPSADLRILDPQDEELASISIIESMDRKMEVTMHLPGQLVPGAYKVTAVLYYTQPFDNDQPAPPETTVVDQAESTFELQPGGS